MQRRYVGPLVAVLLFTFGCPSDPPVCDGGATECAGTCTDLRSDGANCGACGAACAPGSVCSNGACAESCAEGLVSCGGGCVDPLTDPAHCGVDEGCSGGEACGLNAACRGGACVACQPDGDGCLEGAECCSGYCAYGGFCAPTCSGAISVGPSQVNADGVHGVGIWVTSGTTPVALTATRGTFVDGTGSVTFTDVPAVTYLLTCDSQVDPACAGSVVVTATRAGCAAFTIDLAFLALEICTNGKDDDGDGSTDCADPDCRAGTCATGAKGVCGRGAASCTAGGVAVCTQTHFPSAELCDGLDNDCDGTIDGLLTRSCYGGPPASVDPVTGLPMGVCKPGVQSCSGGGWEPCVGQILPAAEGCGDGTANGLDDDCNGLVDDPAGCEPCVPMLCYSGPYGTEGVGICRAGTRGCTQGVLGACEGQIVPVQELCDGKDDDCDGVVDDGPPPCGVGLGCVNGICVRSGCSPEQPCPTGYSCGAGSTCEPALCSGSPCLPGEVCAGGVCVDPCDGIACGAGTFCASGVCTAGTCYVDGYDCSPGLVCRNGNCVPDLCRDVACPIRSFCRDGACLPVCALVSCAAGESCGLDGRCEPDPCLIASCAAGTICQGGTCVTDPCTGLSCGAGMVCSSGSCVDDPCADVDCPVGSCHRGQCDSPFP